MSKFAGDPSYAGFRIKELWAYTQVDPNDDQEGVIAIHGPDGPMPLVASDRVRVEEFEPIARDFANQLGRPVRLRYYKLSKTEKTFQPGEMN
jgi:hypothetical protein